jgi:hypothetical protein
MKIITHVYAVIVAAASAFLATPAGIALLHQYPKLVPIIAGLAGLAALYHNPAKT